jgi:hypothetical protein
MAERRRTLSPQWDPLIVQAAQAHNINPNLLRGILFQESSFNPKLTGPLTRIGTAKGIAQLTPDTQTELGVKNPYDPTEAIPAAARLLAKYRQVAVDRGYENPDAYAAMVYYGGPGFKPGNRPLPVNGVPVAGPDVGEYARSVVEHANAFAGMAPPMADIGRSDDGVRQLAAAGGGPAPSVMRTAAAAPRAAGGPSPLDIALLTVPEPALAMPGTTPTGGRPGPLAVPSPQTGLQRVLSDEEIARMQPIDVLGMVGRGDLSPADRAALDRQLAAMIPPPGGG